MAFAQAQSRPIPGAVATIGVSDRVAFLRKTYGLLGLALIAFAALTGGMMRFMTDTSLSFSMWALRGQMTWILVLVLFMVVGMVARKLAMSETSRGLQLLGLGIAVAAQAILLQPLLWIVMIRFGDAGTVAHGMVSVGMSSLAASIILQSVGITLAIFIGLTLTVFISKKDFSFLRGILTVCTFAALGIIVMSAIFGFHLGVVFIGLMIALMGGYILMQTSMVMSQFPPTAYVAAALMLFSTIATLFWYVLQFVMSMNSSRR
jgi:FtsH-binding integral membrane protein